MVRRTIAGIAGLGLLAGAAAAGAATLSMTARDVDGGLLLLGDTIELTIEATVSGDTAPAQVFVIVRWDSPTADVASLGGPAPDAFTQFGGAAEAIQGGNQGSCEWALGRENQCLVFDQLFAVPGSPVDDGTYTATLSYVVALTEGELAFSFQDAVGSDFNFFNLGNGTDVGTAPAGTSVTILIPEPTTAALLGLGLAGLALRSRGRDGVRASGPGRRDPARFGRPTWRGSPLWPSRWSARHPRQRRE